MRSERSNWTRSDILGLNPWGRCEIDWNKRKQRRTGGFIDVSWFFLPHSNPGTVKACADNDTDPGVNDAVRQMEEEPHSGWSAINLAWAVTSVGERWGISSACVLIHPSGSRSFKRKSSLGSWEGSSTLLLLPRCGTHAMAYLKEKLQLIRVTCFQGKNFTLISLTCLLSGGDTPYRKAATWVLRSAAVMKARRTFLGKTYVNDAASSLTSSFDT